MSSAFSKKVEKFFVKIKTAALDIRGVLELEYIQGVLYAKGTMGGAGGAAAGFVR